MDTYTQSHSIASITTTDYLDLLLNELEERDLIQPQSLLVRDEDCTTYCDQLDQSPVLIQEGNGFNYSNQYQSNQREIESSYYLNLSTVKADLYSSTTTVATGVAIGLTAGLSTTLVASVGAKLGIALATTSLNTVVISGITLTSTVLIDSLIFSSATYLLHNAVNLAFDHELMSISQAFCGSDQATIANCLKNQGTQVALALATFGVAKGVILTKNGQLVSSFRSSMNELKTGLIKPVYAYEAPAITKLTTQVNNRIDVVKQLQVNGLTKLDAITVAKNLDATLYNKYLSSLSEANYTKVMGLTKNNPSLWSHFDTYEISSQGLLSGCHTTNCIWSAFLKGDIEFGVTLNGINTIENITSYNTFMSNYVDGNGILKIGVRSPQGAGRAESFLTKTAFSSDKYTTQQMSSMLGEGYVNRGSVIAVKTTSSTGNIIDSGQYYYSTNVNGVTIEYATNKAGTEIYTAFPKR